ncbi:MAG: hypothetical protein AAFR96_01485 [Planctomycetota bacterium]
MIPDDATMPDSARSPRPPSDEQRLRMFRAAGDAERANRPRWMVLLAGVLFAACAGFALLGLSARASAVEQLTIARAGEAALGRTIADIRLAQQPPETGGIGPFPPLPAPQTRLEQIAGRAGLSTLPAPNVSQEQVDDRISRKIYQYAAIRNPSAEVLFLWLDNVEREILGMRVRSIELKPNQRRNGWELNVSFSRLETSS